MAMTNFIACTFVTGIIPVASNLCYTTVKLAPFERLATVGGNAMVESRNLTHFEGNQKRLSQIT